jgi:hypothetical protein
MTLCLIVLCHPETPIRVVHETILDQRRSTSSRSSMTASPCETPNPPSDGPASGSESTPSVFDQARVGMICDFSGPLKQSRGALIEKADKVLMAVGWTPPLRLGTCRAFFESRIGVFPTRAT